MLCAYYSKTEKTENNFEGCRLLGQLTLLAY